MAKKTSKDAAKSAKSVLSSLNEMQSTSDGDMFADFFGSITPEAKAELDKIDTEEVQKQIDENEEGYTLVAVDKLIPNPLSKFHMREDETWAAIRDMMQKHGFVQGFLVTGVPQGDGTIRLISGHRRTAIAKSLGIKKVPAMLMSVENEAEEIDLVLAANHNRGETITDLLKNYVLCKEKYEQGVWSAEERKQYPSKRAFIASKMGYAESKVRNHEFLLAYDPVIWVMIDERLFTVNDIRKIYNLNSSGKLENHDSVISVLLLNKDYLLDEEVPLDERKKKVTETFAMLKQKKTSRAKAKNISTIAKGFADTLEKRNYTLPTNEKKKKELIVQLDKIESKLQDVRKLLEDD